MSYNVEVLDLLHVDKIITDLCPYLDIAVPKPILFKIRFNKLFILFFLSLLP